MRTLLGLLLALSCPFAAQANDASHNFSAPPQDVLWPAQIVDEERLDSNEWDGDFSIENFLNNTLFIDDNYLGTGNASGISGNAMWGNPRSGEPLGDPYLFMSLDGFFSSSFPEEVLVEQVTDVSFDFAWASTDFDADLTTLVVEVIDYDFNSEYIEIPLEDTFFHSLAGGGVGYEGHVTIQPENVDNVFSIRFMNLSNCSAPGQVGEIAIDNLVINGTEPIDPNSVRPVTSEGSFFSGFSTNAMKGQGDVDYSFNVSNQGEAPTTFSVFWTTNHPQFQQPVPMIGVPIGAGETVHDALAIRVDTDTTPSGNYTGLFTIVNNENEDDEDDEVEMLSFKVFDPPSLTDNTASSPIAPGGQVTLSNAAAGGHAGALRASVKVTDLLVSNGGFLVSGIANGARLDAGQTLTGTLINAGAPAGAYTSELRMKLQMVSPTESYLNGDTPVADRVWTISYTVPPVSSSSTTLTTGQSLAGAGLSISGAGTGAAVIGGSSTGDQPASIAFQDSPPQQNPAGVGSAVAVDFGISTGIYVLQLSYGTLPPGTMESALTIQALNSGTWVPAISLNGNGGATVTGATPFAGSHAAYLSAIGGGTLDTADLGAYGVDPATKTAWVVVDYEGLFQIALGTPAVTPKITGMTYDAASNTATISYQSVAGGTYTVLGSPTLSGFAPIGTTAIGTGAVMQFIHQPEGAPGKYFYRLSQP